MPRISLPYIDYFGPDFITSCDAVTDNSCLALLLNTLDVEPGTCRVGFVSLNASWIVFRTDCQVPAARQCPSRRAHITISYNSRICFLSNTVKVRAANSISTCECGFLPAGAHGVHWLSKPD